MLARFSSKRVVVLLFMIDQLGGPNRKHSSTRPLPAATIAAWPDTAISVTTGCTAMARHRTGTKLGPGDIAHPKAGRVYPQAITSMSRKGYVQQ
jgi:hypothetical protein